MTHNELEIAQRAARHSTPGEVPRESIAIDAARGMRAVDTVDPSQNLHAAQRG